MYYYTNHKVDSVYSEFRGIEIREYYEFKKDSVKITSYFSENNKYTNKIVSMYSSEGLLYSRSSLSLIGIAEEVNFVYEDGIKKGEVVNHNFGFKRGD